jgi:hypothetical protein
MNRDLKAVATWAAEHAPPRISEPAKRLLRKPRRIPREGRTKAQEPGLSRSELRALAMERDGRKCVECGSRDLLHMHHILRADRLECVVMLCFAHHDERSAVSVHAGCPPTLRSLAAYCVERGMPEAARVLSRRLAKVEDMRRAESREASR